MDKNTESGDCLGFWMQPAWPQYRKIVNDKEKCLDGTERDGTVIVKYDRDEEYSKALNTLASQAVS